MQLSTMPQSAQMLEDRPTCPTSQPVEGTETFQLRDGRMVGLRGVGADDAPRLMELCERLSDESSRLRFFCGGRRLTAAEARGLAEIDHDQREAFVAVDEDRVVGLSTLTRLGNDPKAEFTLLVDDAYQGGGLGRHMLGMVIDAARARQHRMLFAEVLPDNERLLGLLDSTGVPYIADAYFGVLQLHMLLQGPS